MSDPLTKEEMFIVRGQQMISGMHELEIRRYKKIECARGVWFVALQPNEADNVYFHNPKDKNSDGFGGATLAFELEDGSSYQAKGPWKGNAGNLFKDTGYDCRNKSQTFVVIGRTERHDKSIKGPYGWAARVITDLVHRDPDGGAIGHFDRYKQILADLPDGDYSYYQESTGGSSGGRQTVDEWWRGEIKKGNYYPERPRK